MDERSTQYIMTHLQREDAQARILQNIQKGRNEAAVTISRAAKLFDFTENKLRDWEEQGFLTPLRPGGGQGRRLYPLDELDKLAIIRELIDAGYTRGDIPANINEIWRAAYTLRRQTVPLPPIPFHGSLSDEPIDLRLDKAQDEMFWRYYAAQALRLSLMLICEEMADTDAGLILPFCEVADAGPIESIYDLPKLSEALLCRLDKNRSSQVLLSSYPSFQVPSDYRLLPLTAMTEDQPDEEPGDATLIFLDRRSRRLSLSTEVVKTIQALLKPLYDEKAMLRQCFGIGMRDVVSSPMGIAGDEDVVLTGLVDMVVRLGGQVDEQPRWRFCYILTPQNSHLPLHQTVLIVRVRNSKQPLYKLGSPAIPPDEYDASIEALESSHIIYFPKTLGSDPAISYRKQEEQESLGSILAIPIGGEDGLAIAVLCIKASQVHAFSQADLRLLRIISKMIEERIRISHIQQQVGQKLSEVIEQPNLVNSFFEKFFAKNDFFNDFERLLTGLYVSDPSSDEQKNSAESRNSGTEEIVGNVVSFIALDVDKQSSIANIYGDLVAKNLCREVGLRLLELLRAVAREQKDCRVYHFYADRFYVLLKDVPLQRARKIAEQLRQGLAGTYTLDALRTSLTQPVRPESMLELKGVTVRLGVTSYPFPKLKEMLDSQCSPLPGLEETVRAQLAEDAVIAVRSTIISTLGTYLDRGRHAGGNVIFTWDEEQRQIVRWSP